MKTLQRTRVLFQLAAGLAAAALITGCGGGSDGEAAAPSPAPAPAPAPGTAGSASECFNEAQIKAGTTYLLNYVSSGALTGTSSTSGTVGSATTFNGQANVLPVTQTVTTQYTAPTAVSVNLQMTSYQRIEGFDVLSYGSVGTLSAPVVGTVETRIVFNPAARDKRYTLSAGSTYTLTQSGTTTVTPPGTSSSTTTSTLVTYVGQETITVPAGTYTTCKFTDTTAGATTTTWIVKGKGVLAKSTTPSELGVVTMQLQASSRLNGAPI